MSSLKSQWNHLIAVGLPLVADSVVIQQLPWTEIASIVHSLIHEHMSTREQDAMRAWLIAMRDHYHSTYANYFSTTTIEAFIAAEPVTGRIIKLRRIASAQLSKVA